MHRQAISHIASRMKIGDKIGWSLAIKVGESISEKSDISYPEHITFEGGLEPITFEGETDNIVFETQPDYLTFSGNTQPFVFEDTTERITF